jgi:hypothetical protein
MSNATPSDQPSRLDRIEAIVEANANAVATTNKSIQDLRGELAQYA